MKRRKRRSGISGILVKGIIFAGVTGVLMATSLYKVNRILHDDTRPETQRAIAAMTAQDGEFAWLGNLCYSEQELSVLQREPSHLAPSEMSPMSVSLIAPEPVQTTTEQPETEVIAVCGKHYRGTLLKIKDASRVFVGTSGLYGEAYSGRLVRDIMQKYGAVAAVNASGFVDKDGRGNGGTPLGLVISEGELKYGYLYGNYEVVGFDRDNVLHCGYMTAQQALNMGIRDSANFGPILVMDGEKYSGIAARDVSYNPRTAIGQMADGTVLILALEGRQISSIGVTLDTLADIMLEYGAVNAGNMDGGASTVMYYGDKLFTNSSSLYGTRAVPTAWLVRPE